MVDDATIISKLDGVFRTVIEIRGRLKIYDGKQELLTTALRRLAAEGRIQVDKIPTKCHFERRQSEGPSVLMIERYRNPAAPLL